MIKFIDDAAMKDISYDYFAFILNCSVKHLFHEIGNYVFINNEKYGKTYISKKRKQIQFSLYSSYARMNF